MELELLLELVASLPEDKKEEVLEEEYRHQRIIIDSFCDGERIK